jgi:iron complex transport system permease protein
MTQDKNSSAAAGRSLILPLCTFAACALLLPWVGAGPIGVAKVLHRQEPDFEILVQLRLTRTLLALVAGGALSLAGALFQAMLRDALATPYTLGISAGASLGAVCVIAAGWQTIWGIPATWVGALAGAFAVLALVLGGFSRRGQISPFGLLLTGVAINSVCSALIIVLGGFVGLSRTFSIARWLIGSVDSTSFTSLAVLSAVVFVLAFVVLSRARGWNLISVGDQWAASRGVDVPSLLRTGYLSGSILVGGAIALTGPIGFVGLIVPHLVRSRVSPDHRVLLPSVFLFGGSLLALCDAVGRVVLPPAEIPAGAVLALIGGPYLVWAIRQRRPQEEV